MITGLSEYCKDIPLFDSQKQLLDHIGNNKNSLILKGRRLGISNALIIYSCFQRQFEKNVIFVVPNSSLINYIHDSINKLRPNHLEIFENGFNVCTPGQVINKTCGFTYHLLIYDDVDPKFINETFNEVIPALDFEISQIIITLSSPNTLVNTITNKQFAVKTIQ